MTRASSPSCVASRVLTSWSEYSLNDTAAISRPTRSDGDLAGSEYTAPSKTSVLCEVGQNWWVLYQPACQIRIAKFGKNWNDDRPQGSILPGLMPGGSSPRSDCSQGPNRPLRVTRSEGLTFSFGISQTRCSEPAV